MNKEIEESKIRIVETINKEIEVLPLSILSLILENVLNQINLLKQKQIENEIKEKEQEIKEEK